MATNAASAIHAKSHGRSDAMRRCCRVSPVELVIFSPVLDQADPTAAREAFVTRRVLDDSVERDVVAYDDLPHFAVLRLRYSLTSALLELRLTGLGYVGGGALLTYKPGSVPAATP